MASSIRRITLTPVRVPVPVERVNCPEFPETLNRAPDGKWGGQWVGDEPFMVVRVEGDGGDAGWGDTARGIHINDFARYAQSLIGFEAPGDDLAVVDAFDGLIAARSEQLPAEIPGFKPIHPAYVRGLLTAVLDWLGKARGKPMHAFFGPRVRDGVRVEYWSGFRTPAGAAKVAREAKRLGFMGLKLKGHLGIDPAGIAREVLAACGPEFSLNIDPNGRWDTYENLLERAKAIMLVNPNVLLEDPLYGNLEPMARVRRETGVRIAKTVGNLKSLEVVLAADFAVAINVSAGLSSLRDVGAAVHAAGLPCWLGSGLECGFSDMASIHMASTLPACTLGSDLIAHLMREDDLLRNPIETHNGLARVPDAPGLGVAADEDAIERYRVGEPVSVG